MSAIAALYNVPLSPQEMAEWAFAHAAHHRDINRVIYEVLAIALPEYVLDPFDPKDMGQWLYQHQAMHQIQDGILGISGYDLSDLTWDDRARLSSWIDLHASEHYQAAAILEIG